MHKDIDITAIREKSGWFLYEMPGLIHEMVIFPGKLYRISAGKRVAFPIETALTAAF